LSELELHVVELLKICDEVEEEEPLEVFGPQIELNLSNPTDMGEPPVEAAGVVPTVVVEVEEESSVEIIEAKASIEKMVRDQAEGTGSTPVLASAEKELGDQVVGAGDKPAHEIVEEIRGAEPVRKNVEDRSGVEPDLMEVE